MEHIERFVSELSEAVWEQSVGVPLVRAASVPAVSGRVFEGHVHIYGPWSGTLVLQCSEPAAQRAAEAFFSSQPPGEIPQNEQDAIGELTNMIGGNLKSLLADEGCSLSLPTVIQGRDYTVHLPQTRLLARQMFTAENEPVVVTLLERVAA